MCVFNLPHGNQLEKIFLKTERCTIISFPEIHSKEIIGNGNNTKN